jgi:hypothetical protein
MFDCLAVAIPSRRQHDAVRLDCLFVGCTPYFPVTVWPMIVSGPSSAVASMASGVPAASISRSASSSAKTQPAARSVVTMAPRAAGDRETDL